MAVKERTLTNLHAIKLNKLNVGLILFTWAFAIGYSFTFALSRVEFTIAIFTMLVSIYLIDELTEAIDSKNFLDIYYLGLCLLIVIITGFYLYINYEVLSFNRTGIAFHYEYILAILYMAVIFALIYRAFGLAFLGVIFGATLYGLYGDILPGLLGHGGLTEQRVLNSMVLDFDGFFGSISAIVAAWVTLFMLYAGLLQGYGAFTYVMRLAFRIADYIRSGIAQSAVVASLLIGSINGAQTANAAMTGSITIPLMKESGMKRSSAAAIEAVASSGGQIMPPIMGAAAFIMASLLGITYWEVVMAGIIPAIAFYFSVTAAVHYKAINQNVGNIDARKEIDVDIDPISRKQFMFETLKFGIPFAVLVITLGYLQYTVTTSALYTAIVMFVTGVTFPLIENQLGWKEVSIFDPIRDTVEGARYGALMYAPIIVIVMGINGIVDILNTTGVPGMLALTLMDLSGGVLIIALILAMIICIILGLGMPTVAAYTLVAMLVAPSLLEAFFLEEITVHYFVLYAAVLSGLTPPIAIAVVITVGIAGANFWTAAKEAVMIAAPLFVLPFSFIYIPEMFISESIVVRIYSAVILFLGALVLTHGLNYYKTATELASLNVLLRVVIIAFGVATMVAPSLPIRILTLFVGLTLIFAQVKMAGDLVGSDIPFMNSDDSLEGSDIEQ